MSLKYVTSLLDQNRAKKNGMFSMVSIWRFLCWQKHILAKIVKYWQSKNMQERFIDATHCLFVECSVEEAPHAHEEKQIILAVGKAQKQSK